MDCRLLAAALSLALTVACDSPEPPEPIECPRDYVLEEGLCIELALPELVIFEGDLHIGTSADATDFCAEYNAVQGDVTLDPNLPSLEALSCLRQVAGDLRIEELGVMPEVRLPNLSWVGGELAIQVTSMAVQDLELERLEGVGEGLTIHFTELKRLAMPSLEFVEGHVSLYANNFLEELDLSALEQVGDTDLESDSVLYVRLNQSLERLDFPVLRQVAGVLKISSNRLITELTMPMLERTGWGFYISYCESLRSYSIPIREVGGFVYLANSYVTSIALPELTTIQSDLNVIFNPSLEALSIPKLESVGLGAVFQGNHSLAESVIDEVLDGVDVGGDIRREDNGG
jgi:hypothetical protein